MNSKHLRRILSTAVCGGLLCLAGCSTLSNLGRGPASDVVEGVTPPYERISDLRDTQDRANNLSPAEAERLAAALAPQCGQEEDPTIRAEMVRTLGALNAQSGRQILLAAAQDSDGQIRAAACEAWAMIGDAAAVAELTRILSSDMDRDVRVAAAKGLGKTGNPRAVAALGSILEDRDPAMQYLAMESLEQCSGEDFGHDARRWQQYVQSTMPTQNEQSVAQRPGGIF